MTEPGEPLALENLFFLSSAQWRDVCANEEFDHVVIGSGPCALAFTTAVLAVDPRARILILERGRFFLPENLQGLDEAFAPLLGGVSEIYPWRVTEPGRDSPWIRGVLPYLGGKSITWSGWCPRPSSAEMSSWPAEVAAAVDEHLDEAEELLGVAPVDQLGSDLPAGHPAMAASVYGRLQRELQDTLRRHLDRVPSLRRVGPARLAVGAGRGVGLGFRKFAVPAPLLRLLQRQAVLAAKGTGSPLRIATNCLVERIRQESGRAVALETSRGRLPLRRAKLILAAGTIPSAMLVMRDFPAARNAGTRLTAHMLSRITARVPLKNLDFAVSLGRSELAALYAAGMSGGAHYHLQLTAVRSDAPGTSYPMLRHHAPDCDAFPALRQLLGSEDFLVVTGAAVGEVGNPDCHLTRVACDVGVRLALGHRERTTWDAMDGALFEVIEQVLAGSRADRVQYWHDGPSDGHWSYGRPPLAQRRLPGVVHEGSTLWIGADGEDVVDLDYRLRHTDNVYVTGGALWPTAGSWNPTLTMVALAQDLGGRLGRATAGADRDDPGGRRTGKSSGERGQQRCRDAEADRDAEQQHGDPDRVVPG